MKRMVLTKDDFSRKNNKWYLFKMLVGIKATRPDLSIIEGVELGAFEDGIGVVALYDKDGSDITDLYEC